MIEEIKIARSLFPNIKHINSYDEAFISKDSFVREWSEKYKKEVGLPFSCDSIVTMLTDEKVRLMAEASLVRVACGIESFSEEVRFKKYNRKQTDEDLIRCSQMLGRHGIHVAFDFIHDSPFETEKDLEKCFWNMIIHLPRPCSFNNYSLSHLPGAELTEMLLKEGMITPSEIVGTSEKGLIQWKVTKSFNRSREHYFWLDLYNLYGRSFKFGTRSFMVPKFWMRFLGKTKSNLAVALTAETAKLIEGAGSGKFLTRLNDLFRQIMRRPLPSH